jgi:PPM family protein phosphatase
MRDGVQVAGMSDLGCQRENNEDRYAYWESDSDAEFERKGRLAIVADGMGGHEGGQEASRIAVEVIERVYTQHTDGDPQLRLLVGFREAHQQIVQYATEHPEFRGMGTTATAIALVANRLYYAHIGDSRLYRVRGQQINRLTRDHSYVGRLFENGVITAEEAESHPQRHILTAALGTGPEFTPDSPEHPIALETGDNLVLCTDGLWGPLTDHEVQQAVTENPPSEACRVLIALARERGGPDNITLQVLRVG